MYVLQLMYLVYAVAKVFVQLLCYPERFIQRVSREACHLSSLSPT